jgi:hypothetical protein
MNVIELLNEALTTAQIIGVAYPPTDAQTTQAFRALIGLTDTMAADPLKTLTNVRFSFPLAPGKQAYTIGADPSLDINRPRPQSILRANVIDVSVGVNPLHIPIRVYTADQYARAVLRNSPTPYPAALWYDEGYAPIPAPVNAPPQYAPLPGYGTINFIGQPIAANVVEAWTAAPLTQASSLFDDLVFPPEYYEYLLYGTTIRLYPRFGRPPDPTIVGLFNDARMALESANAQPAPIMPLDSGLPNDTRGLRWDARTNSYVGARG